MLIRNTQQILKRLLAPLRLLKENCHLKILRGFAITIALAFVASVYALQHLRNQHQDFIEFSLHNTKSIILIESLRELIEKEAVTLKSRIVQKNEQDSFMSDEQEASFTHAAALLESLVIGGKEENNYIKQLIQARNELHELARRSMNLAFSGFPESAMFVWEESSDESLKKVRRSAQAFIDIQQQHAMSKLVLAEADGQNAQRGLILFVLLAFLISGAIGLSISHQLIKPIKQLIEAARGMSGSDVDIYFRLPRNTQMENLFKTLTGHIRDAVAKSKAAGANLERQKVVRDLHDDLSQTLFAANLMAQSANGLLAVDVDKCKECINKLEQLTKEAMVNMRALLQRAREQDIENTRLDLLILQLCDLQSWRGSIQIQSQLDSVALLPASVQVVFYRIAQEALNNIVKHALAQQVQVILALQDEQLSLSIVDDGVGFDLLEMAPEQLGLNIMRERAQSLGCKLDIQSTKHQGTRLSLSYCLDSLPTLAA